MVEVVTGAKTDLKAGETIDGIGGFHAYGLCETSAITAAERLLPIGLAEGCVLKHNVPKDKVLTYDDVDVPAGRFVDKLMQEQVEYFNVLAGT
jgi:predicted homoserine dehydrogenase-like protein